MSSSANLTALTLLSLAALACSGAVAPQPETGGSPTSTQAAAGEPATAVDSDGSPVAETPLETTSLLDPPDGVWKKDEYGQEYWVHEVPRFEGHYVWMNPERTKVKLRESPPFDLESYDDNVFRLKIYRLRGSTRRGPSSVDLADAAATYAFVAEEIDRLTLSSYDRGLPRGGQWRNGFAVADFDGDGALDLVHGPQRKRPAAAVSVFRNLGGGQWSEQRVGLPRVVDYGDVAAADLDGDGDVDLAVASHLLGVTAFRRGDGRFDEMGGGALQMLAQGASQTEPGFSSRAIELGDWDGDGRLDVIAAGEGPRLATSRDVPDPARFVGGSRGVQVFLQRDDGWEALVVPPTAAYGDALAVADLDRDGDLDAVIGSHAGGVRDLLVVGRGAEAPELRMLADVRPGALMRSVAIADLDLNGAPDLVVAYTTRELGVWRTGVDVFYQHAPLVFARRAVWSIEGRGAELLAVAAGDVDGDRRPDIVAFDETGHGLLLLGAPDRRFDREVSPELVQREGCRASAVEVVDLDGDGRGEIVASFAAEAAGMAALVGVKETGCRSGGAIQAWRPAVRSPGAAGG